MNKPSVSVCAYVGSGIGFSIWSLVLDIMGKKRYMNLVENYWVPEYISMPLMAINLLICILILKSQANRGK